MVTAVTLRKLPPADNARNTVIAKPYQFTSLFEVAVFQFTYEQDTMPSDAGGGETQEAVEEITVPGARMGDFVFITSPINVVDCSFVAYVTAANTVTLQVENLTGANSTAFDTATAGFTGLILRFKPNVLEELILDTGIA